MAPKKTSNSKQSASEPETTQPTQDTSEDPPQLLEPKSPNPEGDPEVEPVDEEEILEKQLAEASRQARLAALREKIACEHQCRLEAEARIQNYQNNTNKRPRSGSYSEPAQGETSRPTDTIQDRAMDNQPNSSTTARIPDNDNTSQSSNDNHTQNTPVPESAHEYSTQPARSKTSQPIPKGSPPAPPHPSEKFKGKDIREYTLWKGKIENIFQQKPQYFVNDGIKISVGKSWISDDLFYNWDSHRRELKHDPSWEEFLDFCLREIANPDTISDDAHQKYTEARQKPWQSVRDFASYLKQWEDQFTEPYTDGQRIIHLQTRILKEVRSRADLYAESPRTYNAYVVWLAKVESDMDDRKRAMESGKPSQFSRSSHPDKKPHMRGFKSSHPKGSSNNEKPQSDDSRADKKTRKDKSCFYCKKPGHWINECCKKAADEEKTNTSQPSQLSKN